MEGGGVWKRVLSSAVLPFLGDKRLGAGDFTGLGRAGGLERCHLREGRVSSEVAAAWQKPGD